MTTPPAPDQGPSVESAVGTPSDCPNSFTGEHLIGVTRMSPYQGECLCCGMIEEAVKQDDGMWKMTRTKEPEPDARMQRALETVRKIKEKNRDH